MIILISGLVEMFEWMELKKHYGWSDKMSEESKA